MDWTDEFKRSETEAQENSRIQAELKIRDERMFHAKATESWSALVAEIELATTPEELGKRFAIKRKTETSFMLEGRGSAVPIRCLSVRFMIDGHFIRIVKSYSDDGTVVHADGLPERIRMELQPDDSTAFFGNNLNSRLVQDVARHLVAQVIHLQR